MSVYRRYLMRGLKPHINCNVGDIIVYNNGAIMSIPMDRLTEPIGQPIGVCTIPTSHNVYGNGKAGIMSLVNMSCSNPFNGTVETEYMMWGQYNNETLIPNLNQLTEITTSGTLGANSYGYQPKEDTGAYASKPYSPSPFNSDGSRNPDYYNTEVAPRNAYADFDGKGNTQILVELHTADDLNTTNVVTNGSTSAHSPAAATCSLFHTVGTQKGDWYFPTCGEFCYTYPKMITLNNSLSMINEIYGDGTAALLQADAYWVNCEWSNLQSRAFLLMHGGVASGAKTTPAIVRAYTML